MYKFWTVNVVNGVEIHLFVDGKDVTNLLEDSGTSRTVNEITSIRKIEGESIYDIQVCLGEGNLKLPNHKFRKTVLFSCNIDTTYDLLEFWRKHSDFLRANDSAHGSSRGSSVDLFEESEESQFEESEESQNVGNKEKVNDDCNLEEENICSQLSRNHLLNAVEKKKVACKFLDIFTLLDPPLQFKVREVNNEFISIMSRNMVEKNCISVDNAPVVVGMIDIPLSEYREQDFEKYKVYILDGNHSVKAQKEAYNQTLDPRFRYRSVNIYCGLSEQEAVFIGVSRNEDTCSYMKFTDVQKVVLLRRQLYRMTNTKDTEDPPKQPKGFKDVFASLLNLQGKKAVDGKSVVRFLATSLSSRCFKLYKEICMRSSSNIPASKFEGLRGLSEDDTYSNLVDLSNSDLEREDWHNFSRSCQVMQKKPKKLRKDVAVTFKFNSNTTHGFLGQKPMSGNCISYRFVDTEKSNKEVIFTTEDLRKLVFSSKKQKEYVCWKDAEDSLNDSKEKDYVQCMDSEDSLNHINEIPDSPDERHQVNYKKERKTYKPVFSFSKGIPDSPESKQKKSKDETERHSRGNMMSSPSTSHSKETHRNPDNFSTLHPKTSYEEEFSVDAKVSSFLYNMADDFAAKRAERNGSKIDEDEVEVMPETLLPFSSILLDKEIQNLAEKYFTEDAWTLAMNTLKVLEERFVVSVHKQFNANSTWSSAKGKCVVGQKKGERSIYSFSSEENFSPIKTCKDLCSGEAKDKEQKSSSNTTSKHEKKTGTLGAINSLNSVEVKDNNQKSNSNTTSKQDQETGTLGTINRRKRMSGFESPVKNKDLKEDTYKMNSIQKRIPTLRVRLTDISTVTSLPEYIRNNSLKGQKDKKHGH